jgi:hypothetical protein
MKNILLFTIFIVAVLVPTLCGAQSTGGNPISAIEIQDAVILPYFKALKNGHVKELKKYLSTEMYNEYETLLEQNKEYPEFLRNYYKDAEFGVVSVSEIEDDFEFDINIEFSDGSQSISTLSVSQEKNGDGSPSDNNRWRIRVKSFKR